MTENTTVTPAAEPTQTGLTIQDLSLTLQVIQISSSRGAFKADELTMIGGLYDRIFKFLELSGAITRTPAVETNESTATETPVKETPKKGKVK